MSVIRLGGLLGVVGVLLALAGPVTAQAPRDRDNDLLDKARRAEAVAAQKVEAEVRDAVLEAQRLTASDRDKAVARLKKAITLLEDDRALSDSRRASLQRMLKDRIRVLEAGPAREDERPAKGARDDERRTAADKKAADQAFINQQMDAIRELQRDGKFTEANRLAHELARKYPANPSVLALVRSTSSAAQVADQKASTRDKDRRVVGVYRDVDRSGMPPKGDIEFPKDWAEKTKRRLKSSTQLTAKEKAILEALNLPISADFKESRFEDVMEYLQTVMGQPIITDKSALDDAHVTYETPVTLRIKGKVAARTVLRTILSNLGLYYTVKEEVIMVTTAEKARSMMTTKVYPIGDLVSGGLLPLQLGGGGLDQLAMTQNAKMIIEMITSSVDPPSWKVNGGEGTIVFNLATMSLVVKQSAEVHSMLGGLMR
jgi:hypothetical protein